MWPTWATNTNMTSTRAVQCRYLPESLGSTRLVSRLLIRLLHVTATCVAGLSSTGTSVHSFKFAADFNSPLEHILAMSREFDLTHLWNRYVLESLILAEPSVFQSTLYAASWLPFPFPHIDVVVEARGIDLADVRLCCINAPFIHTLHEAMMLPVCSA